MTMITVFRSIIIFGELFNSSILTSLVINFGLSNCESIALVKINDLKGLSKFIRQNTKITKQNFGVLIQKYLVEKSIRCLFYHLRQRYFCDCIFYEMTSFLFTYSVL